MDMSSFGEVSKLLVESSIKMRFSTLLTTVTFILVSFSQIGLKLH